MGRKDETEPNATDQSILEAWRLLFESETYCRDMVAPQDEPVFGFEVDWDDLNSYEDLLVNFTENTDHTLELGNLVLKEQFGLRDLPTRPVIRVINLPESRNYEVSDLRMRDRNRLLRFDVVVMDVSFPMGWLKKTTYVCNDCDAKWVENERMARERRKVKYCRKCLDAIMEDMRSDNKKPFYKDPNDFSMVAEENSYEDVQYLEFASPNMLVHGDGPLGSNTYQAVVFDEYVGMFSKGDTLTLNALVQIDPMPGRDFVRDTRRMIVLKVHSVEEGLSQSEGFSFSEETGFTFEALDE
ncbi:MAG: hypothetical protein CMA63_04215 [Euryarchaeota archaeon]|nr:hypothetical protein [Euryarchaeota archaeon]|tara:strand:+ start:59354 stop:60247 length:894 start_codon:yes stop_codon:yes gene_type:complete